jgi:hypothetical protein
MEKNKPVGVNKALTIPNRFYPVDRYLSNDHSKSDHPQTVPARLNRQRISIFEAEAVIVDFPVPGWAGIVELEDDKPLSSVVIDQDPFLDEADHLSPRVRQKAISAYQRCSLAGPLATSRGGQLNLIA